MDKNQKKAFQLGMPQGTAANRLRKSVMFMLLKRLNENFCFQCGAEILSEDEISIEHKVAWLDSENPVKLFFDLENISFSHKDCNSLAARKTRVIQHPSRSAYLKNGCRCEDCVKENSNYKKEYKNNRKLLSTGL